MARFDLEVPPSVRRAFDALPIDRQTGAGHILGGRNSERQAQGIPGHCDVCATFGHVVAHPAYGCDDVGCRIDHPAMQ